MKTIAMRMALVRFVGPEIELRHLLSREEVENLKSLSTARKTLAG